MPSARSIVCLLAAAWITPAFAQPVPTDAPQERAALELSAAYTLDLSVVRGGADDGFDRLDNLDLLATARLGSLGWRGATVHAHLLGNSGTRPNDRAVTLEGINNIEVPKRGMRLFEAWLEQEFGGGSVRAGLYDLNSEFYATEASGLLITPPFGIGTELAATGSAGPAIFPSSALGIRGAVALGRHGIVRAALLNARAGTLGDTGGVDRSFDEGLLTIVEAGREGEGGKLMLGAWRYIKAVSAIDPADPRPRHAQGLYLLAEAPLGTSWSGFLRAGLSDGRTGPFRAGWQLGAQRSPALAVRPDSSVAVGFHAAGVSSAERRRLRAKAVPPARTESGIELTYADRLFGPLTLQPDLQVIFNPGGLADADPALIFTLRTIVDF